MCEALISSQITQEQTNSSFEFLSISLRCAGYHQLFIIMLDVTKSAWSLRDGSSNAALLQCFLSRAGKSQTQFLKL